MYPNPGYPNSTYGAPYGAPPAYGTPGYGAPGYGAPPPGWVPPGQMIAPVYPSAPAFPGSSFLPPHLSSFDMHYDADETWDGNPSSVPKELRLLGERKNDIYPQGRDNCMQFLRECQQRGYSFKIKARHTSPYWTWYYEVHNPNRGRSMAMLPPHLSGFETHYNGDETWDGTPADVPKELRLLGERKNDIYPQGRDNCQQFLRECQQRGLSFKIKAKKTRPYWTWYYEVCGSHGGHGGHGGRMSYLPHHLSAFETTYSADETWEGTPSDVPKELRLLGERKNDMYPQGRDNCQQFLRECQQKGYCFRIKAKKTSPYWTWYYELNPGRRY